MHIMDKYVDALNRGDAAYMASLFTEDCFFLDAARRPSTGKEVKCNGRSEVLAFFEMLFSNFHVSVKMIVTFRQRAFYDVTLGGQVLPCIGTVKTDNGLIKELIVEPR